MSKSSATMYCLTTGTSRQSVHSIRASRDALGLMGVDFRIFQITHKFSRRFWRYWRTPIQDLRCLTSLVLRDYSAVVLNPGTSMIARPTLLRLMLLIGRAKRTRMYVAWHSCTWLLEKAERRNTKRFSRAIELIRRENLLNLVVSPQAEEDLKNFTHLSRTVVVGNASGLPKRYESPSRAEAMACFRTVICFAGTGAEFAVGDTGEVIPGFDVDTAADRVMANLRRSPSDRINHDARRRYEMYFSPDAYADRLSSVLSGKAVYEVIE